MKPKQKSSNTTSILLGALALSLIAYFVFGTGEPLSQRTFLESELIGGSHQALPQIDPELVGVFTLLKDVRFDLAIFEREDFRGLVNYRDDVPEQPVGKSNPFSPLVGTGL